MLLKQKKPKGARTMNPAQRTKSAAPHSGWIDPLYLFTRSVQWRLGCRDEAFFELSRAQASPDPITRCIAKALLKNC